MNPFTLLEVFLCCVATYYAIVQIGLTIGIRRLPRPTAHSQPFVSVIVAARNEKATIGELLSLLVQQSYPKYEIIIVNDRSTDSTADIVRSYQESDSRVRLETIDSLSSDLPPKKNALTEGIRSSKGEILCFTDADCVPGKFWISGLVSQFDDTVGVVAGYSPYDPTLLPAGLRTGSWKRVFFSFISGEEFKGALWSAGSIGMNLAWLCTGRNLAYRRSVFDQVGGFQQIKMSVSGDDDLFIQIVRRQTSWNIRYATSPGTFVKTAPPGTFNQFVEQRTRHFSAGKYFTWPMKLFFLLFHASNFLLLIGVVLTLFLPQILPIAIAGFGLKLFCDVQLAISGTRKFSDNEVPTRFRFVNFLLTEFLYIFYNTFVGPLGFLKTFQWKQDSRQ